MKGKKRRGHVGRLAMLLTVSAMVGVISVSAEELSESDWTTVYVDGKESGIWGYIIDGSSLFRLRDVGKAVGFAVDWNPENGSIEIDTKPLHKNETELREQLESAQLNNRSLTDTVEQLKKKNDTLTAWARWVPIACAAAALSLLAMVIYRREMNRNLSKPLRQAEDAVRDWPDVSGEEFNRRVLSIPGRPGEILQQQLRRQMRLEEKYRTLLETADKRGEEQAQEKIIRQICGAFLPPPLTGDGGAAAFVAAVGEVYPGVKPDCTVFDYYPLDSNRLYFAVAQAQGQNAAAASCVAFTLMSIRSLLSAGRSLTETLSDVNARIRELRDPIPVSVLVGILSAVSGTASYVNAGGTVPLLMRSGETYEWLEGAAGVPLGENEQSVYREEKLTLRQGDRLFLYTSALGEAADREGVRFREQAFRSVMNQSRNETRTPEELPPFVSQAVRDFCGPEAELPGFSTLLLEYRRGSKEFSFCTVRLQPRFAQEVSEFLKRRCQDCCVGPRTYARLVVVVDELFALCCRHSIRDDVCRVECSMAPDGRLICVRMLVPLDGKNPLENARESSDANAVDFIRENTEYVKFEPGTEQDTFTVIYPLEASSAPA